MWKGGLSEWRKGDLGKKGERGLVGNGLTMMFLAVVGGTDFQ